MLFVCLDESFYNVDSILAKMTSSFHSILTNFDNFYLAFFIVIFIFLYCKYQKRVVLNLKYELSIDVVLLIHGRPGLEIPGPGPEIGVCGHV